MKDQQIKSITPDDYVSARSYYEIEIEDDCDKLSAYADPKTGFTNIDRKAPFYPGLYILAGAPSVGKTAFAWQLADQLAESGRHVLYFSLGQPRAELATKSIARYALKEKCPDGIDALSQEEKRDIHKSYSAYDIRTGAIRDPMIAGVRKHIVSRTGGRIGIFTPSDRIAAEDIRAMVEAWANINDGIRPVVIVDYIQALKPVDPCATEKANMDSVISALKNLQKDYNTQVVAISSLNRDNYMRPLDYSSLKDFGAIKYGVPKQF